MIPDDLELQHRYICSLARVAEDTSTEEAAPHDKHAGSGKLITALLKPTNLRISVLSARGLPIKESVRFYSILLQSLYLRLCVNGCM